MRPRRREPQHLLHHVVYDELASDDAAHVREPAPRPHEELPYPPLPVQGADDCGEGGGGRVLVGFGQDHVSGLRAQAGEDAKGGGNRPDERGEEVRKRVAGRLASRRGLRNGSTLTHDSPGAEGGRDGDRELHLGPLHAHPRHEAVEDSSEDVERDLPILVSEG